MLIYIDDENKQIKLCLRAEDILHELNKEEEEVIKGNSKIELDSLWRPEYGSYMIESTPGKPFGASISSILKLEENMNLRRKKASKYLKKGEFLATFSMFPLIGARKIFTIPESKVNGPISSSKFTPDTLINSHPRFGTLTKNIKERKGQKSLY